MRTSRELNIEPAIVASHNIRKAADPGPRKPNRKASLITTSPNCCAVAATYDDALPVMNKKGCSGHSCPQKPNRKQSLNVSLSDLRMPMRKASIAMGSDSCLNFEPDDDEEDVRGPSHHCTTWTPAPPTRYCSDSEVEMSSNSCLQFDEPEYSEVCHADDTPQTYYSSDSEYELSSNSCLDFEPEAEEKGNHHYSRPAHVHNSRHSSITLRKPERKASIFTAEP